LRRLALSAGNAERDLVIQGDGKIGIGTTSPQRAAHINDTLRIEPRSAAPTSPGLGDLYVDSDTNTLCFYNSTAWTGMNNAGPCT